MCGWRMISRVDERRMTEPQNFREQIESAIRAYISTIRPGPKGEDARLSDLALVLDRLIAVYYLTPDVGPDAIDSEGPRTGEKLYAESAAAAFPELGWYALVDPEGDVDQQVGLSIANGDLAEIAVDLDEVLWLFEHASENDAIWQFRWGYQHHWGRHAHELRLYLHTRGAW